MKMTEKPPFPRFADTTEITRRSQELQYLINVVEPDPEFQPAFVSDEATLLDCLGADEESIFLKLRAHFGARFTMSIRQPVWRLVDEIRGAFPGWPDEDAND